MAADRCRQTLDIAERTLDGSATARDREHVPGCETCTQALGRLPAFERDLGAAARSLAAEPLAVSLLTSPAVASGRTWTDRSTRALGLVAVAAVIVVVAVIGVGRFARLEGGPGSTPALMRPETSMIVGLTGLGLNCRSTILDPKPSPQLRGSLCTPALTREGTEFIAAIERDPAGDPAAVVAKATVEPVAGAAGRTRVTDLILKIAGLTFADESDAAAAQAWVRSVLPVGDEIVHETTNIGGIDVTFEVIGPGHYFLRVGTPPS